MALTKRDFQAAADLLLALRRGYRQAGDTLVAADVLEGLGGHERAARVLRDPVADAEALFISFFRMSNTRFDEKRFHDACNGYDIAAAPPRRRPRR